MSRYWSAWIVATMSRIPLVPAPFELLEQEVADAGAVERRAVERLVRDVDERPPARPEATAKGHPLWSRLGVAV
jgi:hypothetical protein